MTKAKNRDDTRFRAVAEPQRSPAARAGYAAAVAAFSFAVVSLYWALGGMALVETLGPDITQLARERDSHLVTAVWISVVLKVVGGLLALALVRPWGRHLPQTPLLLVARVAAVLLTTYGAVQTTSVALMLTGVIAPHQLPGRDVLWWRLLLWEPWFVAWGLLLLLATRRGRTPATGAITRAAR